MLGKIVIAVLFAALAAVAAVAQTAGQGASGVNPPVGSIWTFLGPTFGAAWVPNPNKSPPCTSIESFGGKGDDIVDNSPAFAAAMASTNCLFFPAGVFRFNTAITYGFPANGKGVTISGQGQDVSVLHFPNAVGNALTINLLGLSNSFHLRDFTITTDTTNVDTAIAIALVKPVVLPRRQSTYAANDITRVTLRSNEGYWEEDATYTTHGWKVGIRATGVSVVDFVGIHFYGPTPPGGAVYAAAGGNGGTGIIIEGAAPGTYIPVLFNFDRVNINWAETAIVYGAYVQGFQIVQSNLTGNQIGVRSAAGTPDLAQLTITASQLNNIRNVVLDAIVEFFTFTSNLVFLADDVHPGIEINVPSWRGSIANNVFMNILAYATPGSHSGIGISIKPPDNASCVPQPWCKDPAPLAIVGNSFWGLSTGVVLGPNTEGELITDNIFRNNTVHVANTSTDRYNGNVITGAVNNPTVVSTVPVYRDVTGAVDNGAGWVRVTVADTNGLVTGMLVVVGGLGGVSGIDGTRQVMATITVIDGTHVDLNGIAAVGPGGGPMTYTGGGMISTVPL